MTGELGTEWRLKKPQINPTNGYYGTFLVLRTYGRGTWRQNKKYWMIHRLVLLAFRGEPPKGHVCRHLNGNRTDNRLENIVWGTSSENRLDQIAHGTHNAGEDHPSAVLSEGEVKQIMKMRKQGIICREIASMLGRSIGVIKDVASGRTWRHVKP